MYIIENIKFRSCLSKTIILPHDDVSKKIVYKQNRMQKFFVYNLYLFFEKRYALDNLIDKNVSIKNSPSSLATINNKKVKAFHQLRKRRCLYLFTKLLPLFTKQSDNLGEFRTCCFDY